MYILNNLFKTQHSWECGSASNVCLFMCEPPSSTQGTTNKYAKYNLYTYFKYVHLTKSNSFRHSCVVKEREMLTERNMGPDTTRIATKPFQGDNR